MSRSMHVSERSRHLSLIQRHLCGSDLAFNRWKQEPVHYLAGFYAAFRARCWIRCCLLMLSAHMHTHGHVTLPSRTVAVRACASRLILLLHPSTRVARVSTAINFVGCHRFSPLEFSARASRLHPRMRAYDIRACCVPMCISHFM